MLKQTLTHLLRICAFLIDLIDSNDHRHIGGLGMLNGFNRLRHQAVIGCHDQNYDIRYRGTALTHLRERFVPWGIEEGDDRAILCLYLIRANMLRDSASFASHNICTAQGVQKRCLTMVDMPHHGHDRRTGLHRFGRVYVFIMSDINVGIRHACDVVAKLFDEQFCGILVDGFVDRDGHAHLEKRLDKIAALFRHTVSKFLHRDGFGHDHIACLLDLRLPVASAMRTLFFFTRTLKRRKRTRAGAIIALKCTRNGKLARLAAVIRCAARWALRSFFNVFTLTLRALWRFNRRKAARRWSGTVLVCVFGGGFDRSSYDRYNRFCNRWWRRRSSGFLTVCLGALTFFVCALGALFCFPAAAFFKH